MHSLEDTVEPEILQNPSVNDGKSGLNSLCAGSGKAKRILYCSD